MRTDSTSGAIDWTYDVLDRRLQVIDGQGNVSRRISAATSAAVAFQATQVSIGPRELLDSL